MAYGVASVSGAVLAVCSCTVLPLFAGIYRMGAGLGPATAFLYSGPAINVLAIVLTARVLGLEMGIARTVGSVVFSVVIGLLMHLIFRKEESSRSERQALIPEPEGVRPLGHTILYFAAMIAVLIFANWAKPAEAHGVFAAVHSLKWILTSVAAVSLSFILIVWFDVSWKKVVAVALPTAVLALVFRGQPLIPFTAAAAGLAIITSTSKGEMADWFDQAWGFAKQILPLLLLGVALSGLLLGRPGHDGVIPSEWVSWSVGGNSLRPIYSLRWPGRLCISPP
jgi:uncharacterized membrane protein YraQ (UPF0718 family)